MHARAHHSRVYLVWKLLMYILYKPYGPQYVFCKTTNTYKTVSVGNFAFLPEFCRLGRVEMCTIREHHLQLRRGNAPPFFKEDSLQMQKILGFWGGNNHSFQEKCLPIQRCNLFNTAVHTQFCHDPEFFKKKQVKNNLKSQQPMKRFN